jgi:intein/homing endonuclease
MFRIISESGKSVVVTEDHGLMVKRGEEIKRISPLEYLPGDLLITATYN